MARTVQCLPADVSAGREVASEHLSAMADTGDLVEVALEIMKADVALNVWGREGPDDGAQGDGVDLRGHNIRSAVI